MAVQSTAFERRVDMIAGIEAMRQFLEAYNQNFGTALLLWPFMVFMLLFFAIARCMPYDLLP